MAETRLQGRPASPGLILGPLFRLDEGDAEDTAPADDPAAEHGKLDTALEQAASDLAELMADASDDGAEILAFQSAMLDDPALVEDARTAIDEGASALDAWRGALDEQIEGFRAADDEYFRARALDLEDLKTRVADLLSGRTGTGLDAPAGAILCGADLTPSRFLTADWQKLKGIALARGSAQSHVAMLARARGVPMVVELGPIPETDADAVLDARAGTLVMAPDAATRAAYATDREALDREVEAEAALLTQPAHLPSGERVACLLNIDAPEGVDAALLDASDGIGLWRTEFLFLDRPHPPSEDEQVATYKGLLDRLGGRPVIARTLDIGGDKPLSWANLPRETNPFLGLRGLRLCLERPELFKPQVRALLRAAPGRNLEVMLPMVSRAAELAEARAFFQACLEELEAEGVDAAMPPLGMMVETPASAVAIDTFDPAFVSIGSNDLVQYTMAASREATGRVAALADPLDPAVLRLVETVVRHGRATGLPVSLCGDMAADPRCADRLLAIGLRRLSVGPAALARLKRTVAGHAG